MYVVLLGAPGAGKGTQADILNKKLKLAHIASGRVLTQFGQIWASGAYLARICSYWAHILSPK